jgi:hypothetical protein
VNKFVTLNTNIRSGNIFFHPSLPNLAVQNAYEYQAFYLRPSAFQQKGFGLILMKCWCFLFKGTAEKISPDGYECSDTG